MKAWMAFQDSMNYCQKYFFHMKIYFRWMCTTIVHQFKKAEISFSFPLNSHTSTFTIHININAEIISFFSHHTITFTSLELIRAKYILFAKSLFLASVFWYNQVIKYNSYSYLSLLFNKHNISNINIHADAHAHVKGKQK